MKTINAIRKLDNMNKNIKLSTMPSHMLLSAEHIKAELEAIEHKREREARYAKRIAYRTASHVVRARKSGKGTVVTPDASA